MYILFIDKTLYNLHILNKESYYIQYLSSDVEWRVAHIILSINGCCNVVLNIGSNIKMKNISLLKIR